MIENTKYTYEFEFYRIDKDGNWIREYDNKINEEKEVI